MAYKKETG